MRLKWFVLLIVINITPLLSAQTDSSDVHIHWNKNKLAISTSYQNGMLLPTNIFVLGVNSNSTILNRFEQIAISLSTQTSGNHLYEKLYNSPRWGITLSTMNFYDVNEIGTPWSINGFFHAPFLRFNQRLSLNYQLDLGLAFNWNPFNSVSNPYNVAMGATTSFLTGVGMNLEYALTEDIDINGGLHFMHFSNGALKMPNEGFNTISPSISLKYNLYKRPRFIKQVIPAFTPHNEWVFSTFAGIKNVILDPLGLMTNDKYKSVNHTIYGLSVLFNRQISYSSRIGLGMTVDYNNAINAQMSLNNGQLEATPGPFMEGIQVSIYPSYEICADKLSMVLQPAFYIFRKSNATEPPTFHQRVMVKYHLTDQLFIAGTLRVTTIHADFLEWTIGYRFSK